MPKSIVKVHVYGGRRNGAVTTYANTVDIIRLMRWRNRLNTEHIFYAVRESLNG